MDSKQLRTSIVLLVVATLPNPSIAGSNRQEQFDKSTLVNLLRSSYEDSYSHMSLKYEGLFRFTDVEAAKDVAAQDGVYVQFSGTFKSCPSNGRYYIDLILNYPGKRRIDRQTMSIENKTVIMFTRDENGAGAKLTESEARDSTLSFKQSYGVIYPHYRILGLLSDPNIEVKHVGQARLGDDTCDVVELHYHKGLWEKSGNTLYHKIWIDFGRGGQIVMTEHYSPSGRMSMRVKDIELKQFENRAGEAVWLPIHGTAEYYGEDGRPANILDIYALTKSVSFKEQCEPSDFIVDAGPGLFRANRAADRSGTRPMSDAQADAMLADYLEKVTTQGAELRASSYSRDGDGLPWLYWVSPAVSLVALVAAVVLYIRARA